MDPMDLKDQTEEISESPGSRRFNQMVAVTVAIVAVFMALAGVKDDNICQSMVADQAKSIKQHLYELQATELQLQLAMSNPSASARSQVSAQVKHVQGEAARYAREKGKLKDDAEATRKDYARLAFRDDQFDLGDALMGLAIALLAVSTLVESRMLFGLGATVAALGVMMGLAGFFGWPIHPDIIKFLT